MAHVEPMDIDGMESDYEDKENSILHSNALPKIPCTDKGYEELDVSELNMKLRYSITPASSPMSRSYTANCKANKNIEDKNSSVNISNADLTSSLNSTLTNNDTNKASKVYPLQTLPTDNLNDMNRSVLIPKSLVNEGNNITITVSDKIDEIFSIPSTSSSIPHTPEATTPTKELPKDGGSPIMRGLRSVLSMFKPQSPQPLHEPSSQADSDLLQAYSTITDKSEPYAVQVSTPLCTTNRISPKRTSPLKEILVFNDDLEKELQWNDDSTILFKEEKIPKHKLFLQESIASNLESKILNKTKEEGNKTLEYMDISYNETIDNNKSMADVKPSPCAVLEAGGLESDGEFVDCETTYIKDEIESLLKSKENISMHNSIQHISMNAEVNTSDFTKNTRSLNLTLPVESSDLLACTSKDVANSKVSSKNTSGNNLDSNNVLQETFSLTYSKDRSLCETELLVNSDINICDSMVNNYSALNVEVNKINKMEVGSAHNVTDTVQCIAEQIKDNIVVTHVNETYPKLHEIGNELERKENCIDEMNDPKIFIPMKEDDVKTEAKEVNNVKCSDTVQFGPVDEDAKSKEAVCSNSLTSEIDPSLSQITCNTKNEETVESLKSEAIDLNIKNKIAEETNKDIMEVKDFLVLTSNNIHETLEINFSDNVPRNNCKETLSQKNNIGIEECAESSNEINNSNNVENELHDAEIILPESELNKKMPFDIPLPTDSDFDKNIVDICEANQISEDIDYEVNEIVQSSKINANDGLDKLSTEISNVMEAMPILKAVDKTIDHINDFVSYEPKSILDNNEKCGDHTMACNKTFDKDNSFEITEKDQEVNKSVLPQSDENRSNKIIEPMNNHPVDNVIDEKPETFNDSLQPSNTCEIFELYANEISKNEFSLHCDTNSNFEKLDEEACSNMEQLSNPFETKNKLHISPPLSPSMIDNRGYNIDFDDIENPFATKTKIRQSPTPEIPGQVSLATEDNNTQKVSANLNKSSKRKSYPIRKPMKTKNNSLNATFDCSIKKDCKESFENYDTTLANTKKESYFITDASELPNTLNNSINKPDLDIENNIICINNNKNEAIEDENLFSESARDITKSVFNCPEINDMNFYSFSDKQKTMSSNLMMPSGDITMENEECLKPKIDSLEFINPEVINDQQMTNVDNETSVSRDSKNSDMKEVNTEDEDTATFNETTEFIENDKENASSVKGMLAFEVSHTALDSDNVDSGEMFIDAEAFEFLLNQNKSNVIADSGKESLFLKFDPLFTKRVSSDGIIAALKRVQNNQSTPKKVKLKLDIASEMPGTSQKETLDDAADDASIQAMSKPMMVVNPAINSIVSPRKVATPKVNRQSLTFTSPAMAVIDKLLSLSGNSLITDHNTPASSPVRQHNETDIAITQLREMLADKDIHVHNLRSESKELKDRLSSLEAQVKSLEVESAERLKKVNDLNEILIEKTKINKSMANVVEEYERTIASLITQIEQEKKNNAEERIMLIKERDEQTAHLASMEVSFNDLHSKYEKSKQLIYSMKANEETYKKSIQEFEESFAKLINNYELLKQHATSKLNHASLELEKFNRAHEAEVLKLNALIKRKELHITSLEETLAQKTKANEELTAICDELINKVG